MRNCALWITPWVDRNQEVILDTRALTETDWRAVVHDDPDVPPKDTVLVLVHPARHHDLMLEAQERDPFTSYNFTDTNGRHMAARLIDQHCYRDPELRRRLEWRLVPAGAERREEQK